MTRRSFAALSLILVGLVALSILWRGGSAPLAVHTIHADDAMLRKVRELGAQYVVQVLPWQAVQPSPDRWDWEYSDWLVRAAAYYDLRLILRLDKPPAWAVDDPTAVSSPPRDPAAFAAYAGRVAGRYRGRVAAYVVWNEPNLAIEWGNGPPDATAYARLLEAVSASIRAADPEARIAAAALGPTDENSARAQNDLSFLESLYASMDRSAFDALAVHPYAIGRPPDAAPGSSPGFDRLLAWRDIMRAHGDEAKPLWITEFGYPTEQPPGYQDRVVDEAEQADWLARAVMRARGEMPFVQLFTVWNLVRDLPTSDEQAGYSLLRRDGSPKPAFARLRALAQTSVPDALLARLRAPGVARTSAVQVLAPDAIVHLGDSEYPAPFVPLYGTRNPSTDWKGEFYLTANDLEARSSRPWKLSLELMQANDFDTRVWVNDVPVAPEFLPVTDFTSKWVTAQFEVAPGALRAGYNAVSLRLGKLLPAFQQPGFTWDDFQFRNVQLIPP